MKIAAWNVERLKHRKDNDLILREIGSTDADILVLTETDSRLDPAYPYRYQTPLLTDSQEAKYADTENRVTVFSRYEAIAHYQTFDDNTAISVELATDRGNLLIYGTIMGIKGNRDSEFKESIVRQMDDVKRLSAMGKSICVIGDYNLSFSDNYYFTIFGRDIVNKTFADCGLTILTKDIRQCVDHIAVSDSFLNGAKVSVTEWDLDKALSDHKGIMVEF